MSDIGIFIIGCGVFGLSLTATLVAVIGPSHPDVDEKEVLESAKRELRKHRQQEKIAS